MMKYNDKKSKSPRDTSKKFPGKKPSTLVTDRVQYAPNFDTKSQAGLEAAMQKVGKKYKC